MYTIFLAQTPQDTINVGGTTLTGPLVGIASLSDLINRVLLFVVPFAGILLFFALVFGGYSILMSQGNPEKLKTGKSIITAALIGFALLVFAFFIVRIVGFMLNLKSGTTPFY